MRIGEQSEKFDLVIFGAGIFGLYAALHFDRLGQKVALVDTEEDIWRKASAVNQARVHTGYHYPRSIKTARMALENRTRFLREHDYAINQRYSCYYAIDKRGSYTSADQFRRFCAKLDIPLSPAFRPDIFYHEMLEGLFLTEEYSFDPLLLRDRYVEQLRRSRVNCFFGYKCETATNAGAHWEIEASGKNQSRLTLRANKAINATYANINTLNDIFGFEHIGATHEISELVLLYSEQLRDIALTVMDGPFLSIMPFGNSGLHSLSSVLYTHKAFSADDYPRFDCQTFRADCTPEEIRDCSACRVRPASNRIKMMRQARLYVKDISAACVHGSIFTVKTKLKSALMDDGRPTDIKIYSESPLYCCIFSGKINSIYEIEEALSDA